MPASFYGPCTGHELAAKNPLKICWYGPRTFVYFFAVIKPMIACTVVCSATGPEIVPNLFYGFFGI
jgi:hypothetical protein